MKFLLDTNTCIYIINRKPPSIFERLAKVNPSAVGISVVTVFELVFGIEKVASPPT